MWPAYGPGSVNFTGVSVFLKKIELASFACSVAPLALSKELSFTCQKSVVGGPKFCLKIVQNEI
jgi:hypothetical protein